MYRTILLLGLFLANSLALAAPPTLSLPASVTGQSGAFIAIPATTTGKNVKWLSIDPGLNLFPTDLLKDNHTAVVSSGTPGSYRLLAITAAGDELSVPALCTVVIQGATLPAPAPTPNPPPPSPPATEKAAWVIVVLDNNARTPAQAQFLSSQTLLTTLQQRGVTLRVLDATDPLVASQNYQPAVTQAGGPPALLVFDDKSKRIKALKLPGDEAGFLAVLPAPPTLATPACGPNGCPFCPRGSFIYPEIAR